MPVHFTFWPALLLIPLLLPYLRWVDRRGMTDIGAARRRAALLLRTLLVVLLVLVLSGFRLARKGDSLAVMFVVDGSRSIREDQQAAMTRYLRDAQPGMRSVDKAGVITFAQDAHTLSLPGQPLDAAQVRDPGVTTATDIAQALRQARTILRTTAPDSGKRIVLLSDGNENRESVLAEVGDLKVEQIVLDTVSLPANLKQEALIERLILPARVKIGEPFQVRVIVDSLTAQTGIVALMRDDKPAAPPRHVALRAGKNTVVFEQSVGAGGFLRYRAQLEAEQDTLPENNVGEGYVWVQGKPSVLYVADSPEMTAFLRAALKSQNIDVSYAPPEALPTTPAALQRFDSIFVSNVRAVRLSAGQMNALQSSCRDFGIGFGMVGGENSFGIGGYRRTPIEEMLPVDLDIRKMQRFPPVCVALVIDRSGSMEEGRGPGARKIDLAVEAAVRAVEALKPTDKVTVVTFDDQATVQVPPTFVQEKDRIIGAIRNIAPGGGTSIFRGLSQAYDLIRNDESPIKHIILLTDGVSNDPDYGPITLEMKRRKITVTGVVVGAGTQATYADTLVAISKTTGGRFYSVDNAADIPGIYLQEIERISSRPIVEEPFIPRPSTNIDSVLPGISWSGVPPLLGYNVALPRPSADILLTSHHNDPIFAAWRYGLGRSVAFLSDDRAKWSAQWQGWSGYGKFWAQMVRWTLRPFAPSDYATQVTMENGRGHVVVDALDRQGGFVNRLALRARVAPPEAGAVNTGGEIPLRQTGPGRYEGWFDAPETGTYLVNVLQKRAGGAETSAVVGLSTAYPSEYRAVEPNRYLMAQLASLGMGRTDPPATVAFGGNRPGILALTDMRTALLLLTMLLFPLDIALRRLAIGRKELLALFPARSPLRAAAPTGRAATQELGRLLDRKEAAGTGRGLSPHHVARSSADASGPTSEQPPVATHSSPIPLSVPQETPGASQDEAEPLAAAGGAPAAVKAPVSEETGLSRLKAAKRRANERVDPPK